MPTVLYNPVAWTPPCPNCGSSRWPILCNPASYGCAVATSPSFYLFCNHCSIFFDPITDAYVGFVGTGAPSDAGVTE